MSNALKSIRLEIARSREHPNGSALYGYEFAAPLDQQGHIDVASWKEHRERCRVRRFWEGEKEKIGRLMHKPGGTEHARWVFDYDDTRVDDDEAGYRFGAHSFVPGEYVTIRDNDAEHTLRVVSVQKAAA